MLGHLEVWRQTQVHDIEATHGVFQEARLRGELPSDGVLLGPCDEAPARDGLAGQGGGEEAVAVEAEAGAVNVGGREQVPGALKGRHHHLHVGQRLPPRPAQAERDGARGAQDDRFQVPGPGSTVQVLHHARHALLELRTAQADHIDVDVGLRKGRPKVLVVGDQARQHHATDDAQVAPVKITENATRAPVKALQEDFLRGDRWRLRGPQGWDKQLAIRARRVCTPEPVERRPDGDEVPQVVRAARSFDLRNVLRRLAGGILAGAGAGWLHSGGLWAFGVRAIAGAGLLLACGALASAAAPGPALQEPSIQHLRRLSPPRRINRVLPPKAPL
mmetsp:Transcript_109754/g.328060  ORF Transcript_109754/g.328060 Transcript_109754/m.328060 type:complete len:332 (+) Transcript_109754:787-1782(+)